MVILKSFQFSLFQFSSPEAALLLVSTKNRLHPLGRSNTGKFTIHGFPVTLHMLRIKSDNLIG